MHSFLIALAFLSVTPIRFRALPADEAVARSRFWYAAVGLLLGALLAGWTWAAGRLAPPGVAAFFVLLAWVGVTGALHLDGFCDLCDGLFGGWTPEDRLRIMKDPQRGAFAIVGCVLLLQGKYAALVQLMQLAHCPLVAPWAVGVAVLAARCLVLTLAAGARYPRAEGTGKLLIEATRSPEAVAFALLAWGAMILSPHVPLDTEPRLAALDACYRATLCFVLIWLLLLLLRKQCERRLGGITGDCLGAGIELVELVFLLSMAMSL